ncbi:MAG: 50S ribosomal protein L13 [Clostridia bacterium]
MKTMMPSTGQMEKKWYLVDASGKTLGRLASELAKILMGKHKPEFSPHTDAGDFVVVINAEKVVVTGKKEEQKMYRHHTGWVGNLKEVKYRIMMEKHPERILGFAVKGMLPKTSLGRAMYKKLKIFVGPEHNHQAQQPVVLDIKAS